MNWLEERWYSHKPAPCALLPFESLFRFLSKRKKREGLEKQWVAPVPVVIVGNISAGGTGKTPLSTFLVSLLRANGFKPGIVSRGYKSKAAYYPFDVSKAASAQETGDEPFMLHARCQCPVIIDADRVAASEYLLGHYDCDVIISDDGLQHYRLGRDIEIAVVDSKRGLGNKHQLPAGPLREPASRLNTVDYIVTNGGSWDRQPSQVNSYEMNLVPTCLKHYQTKVKQAINSVSPLLINAVAGIGHPQRFFDSLSALYSGEIVCHPKPDHYLYTQQDFDFDVEGMTIMTEKDAVKVSNLNLVDAWYLEVSAQLPDHFSSAFIAQLEQIVFEKGNRNNG